MRCFLVQAALVVATLPAFAPGAVAHPYIHRAIPAVGSTVATSPTEMDCRFTEELEPRFSAGASPLVAPARPRGRSLHDRSSSSQWRRH